jgi:hypothetical protein
VARWRSHPGGGTLACAVYGALARNVAQDATTEANFAGLLLPESWADEERVGKTRVCLAM